MLFKQNARPDQSATATGEGASPAKLPLPPSVTERLPIAAAAPAPAPAAAPVSSFAPDVEGDTGKKLIVGKGIQLKGEITACDRLIVEGQVEVTMNATRTLEIKSSGHFIGSCEVEEAEISGIYDGDLTVRGRLVVHNNGRVKGKICYGELELQRGGQIAGELSVRDAKETLAAPLTPGQHKPVHTRNAA